MKRAMQTGFLIVCGYLGMWLLVCFFVSAMVYGTAANTPDWVFWAGLALAIPLYLVLCGPVEVLNDMKDYEDYKGLYVYYRDLHFETRAKLRDETIYNGELRAEIKKLKSELEEAKACKCRKVTVCVRRCGK
jgi:hypothetical protein